jgi:hypothetical protein
MNRTQLTIIIRTSIRRIMKTDTSQTLIILILMRTYLRNDTRLLMSSKENWLSGSTSLELLNILRSLSALF